MRSNLKLYKMAAIKGQERPDMIGNDFWKIAFNNGTIGRNRRFEEPEELRTGINDWLEIMKKSTWKKQDFIKSGQDAGKIIEMETQTPLTIQSLCLFLGVHSQYLNDFEDLLKTMEDREKANEFSLIIARAKTIISNQKLEGAMVGAYNPMIVARIEGLKEKTDITSNDKEIQGIGNIVITREDYKPPAKEDD